VTLDGEIITPRRVSAASGRPANSSDHKASAGDEDHEDHRLARATPFRGKLVSYVDLQGGDGVGRGRKRADWIDRSVSDV
jgi:hypothetical protein